VNDVFVSHSDEQQNDKHAPADQRAAVAVCEDRRDDGPELRPDQLLAKRRAALAVAGFAL
jgi:hypothetical protein